VERINGSILLLSASKDEAWPSAKMSNKIIEQLKRNDFKNYHKHIMIEGGHTAPLKHFDLVFDFLEKTFPVKSPFTK